MHFYALCVGFFLKRKSAKTTHSRFAKYQVCITSVSSTDNPQKRASYLSQNPLDEQQNAPAEQPHLDLQENTSPVEQTYTGHKSPTKNHPRGKKSFEAGALADCNNKPALSELLRRLSSRSPCH